MNKKLTREILTLSSGVKAMRVAIGSYIEPFNAPPKSDDSMCLRMQMVEEFLRKHHEEAESLLGKARRSRTMSRKIAEE